MDQVKSGEFWRKRNELVFIGPQHITAGGRVREAVAYLAVAAALGMMVVGLLMPQRLGLANNRVVFLAGPALVLAAIIHLFLVISAVRGAWAVLGEGGIKMAGRKIKWSQVRHPRVETVDRQGVMETALVMDVAWHGVPNEITETVPLVPAGMTDDADLRRLLVEIRRFVA